MGILDDLDGTIESDKDLSTKKDIALNTEDYKQMIFLYECFLGTGKLKGSSIAKIDATLDLIDRLSTVIPDYKDHDKFHDRTGQFISMLINAAYNNDHNNFRIYLPDLNKPIDNIARSVGSINGSTIEISIASSAGKNCGAHARNISIRYQTETGPLAADHIQNSTVVFKQRAIKAAGFAYNSDITFENEAYSCADYTDNCDIYLLSNASSIGKDAKNSRFYSPHTSVLDNISKNCGKTSILYLLDNNGNPEPYKWRSKLLHKLKETWRKRHEFTRWSRWEDRRRKNLIP